MLTTPYSQQMNGILAEKKLNPVHHSAGYELAARAAAYLEEHYTDKFSLDAIASTLYIDKIYLAKCFKQATGDTLLQYHNRLRCEEAKRLLSSTDLPIEEVSSQVGYVTPSHFSRLFRKYTNMSPTQYRLEHSS